MQHAFSRPLLITPILEAIAVSISRVALSRVLQYFLFRLHCSCSCISRRLSPRKFGPVRPLINTFIIITFGADGCFRTSISISHKGCGVPRPAAKQADLKRLRHHGPLYPTSTRVKQTEFLRFLFLSLQGTCPEHGKAG